MAVVYDSSIDTNDSLDRVQMYINGNPDTITLAHSTGTLGDIPDGNANLAIGAAVASNGDVGYSLDGSIDEVELFNRTLTSEEISAIFEADDDGKSKVMVDVDIKPTSCPNPINFKSKDVLPVAILGTEDFNVTEIDPETVRLMGVSPLRWAIEDVATPFDGEITDVCSECTTDGPDGYDDLTLKFGTQEVVTALGSVEIADCVFLLLTGNIKPEFGGTAFAGQDVVKIINKIQGCNLVSEWELSYTQDSSNPGPYDHVMDINTQSFSGLFNGTGYYPAGIWTWIVEGSVNNGTVYMTITYDQEVAGTFLYQVELDGTIVDCETSMSGTATDNRGHSYTWIATRP
ncbi:LamG-like jellyroll fold domain-containing protein [Chloroflexota bacterium]